MKTITCNRTLKSALLAGVALAMFNWAPGASAQDTPAAAKKEEKVEKVVVTGTAIRGNTKSVSPITVVDADEMDKRGINTVQDAIQQLNVNNGPAIVNGWAQRGFTPGASGASLRGLTSSSTLVLFDGLRASYYPLGDDASRNFVDLNTIPDEIVDRVEVLRDGASSLYGADAIGGVINIITKREFQGVSARGEYGISESGVWGQNRESLTMGTGDLDTDGYNFYISGNRYHSDLVYARDLPYPFNTSDWSGVCFEGSCDTNAILNQNTQGAFALSTAANFMLRPSILNANGTTTFDAGSRWQHANALDPCTGEGVLANLTVAQQGTANPATVCQYDLRKLYNTVSPEIDRWNVSARGTATLKNLNSAEAWFEVNFLETTVFFTESIPAAYRANAPTGIFYPRFSTFQHYPTNLSLAPGSFVLYLPNWVCPERVNCATSPNRVLNTANNPFANATPGLERVASIIGRNHDEVPSQTITNRTYRGAAGLSGDFTNGWSYDLSAVVMHTDLLREWDGTLHIQHLLDVIADGTYNFANPSANSQAIKDYVAPHKEVNSISDQVQFQGTLTVPVFELDGGTALLAVGASARYEAIDAPSGNTDFFGPTQRYFTINAFGAEGSRQVYATFAEINLPVLENLDVNLSGRYDTYSTGAQAFSPKVGARWKVWDELTLRGTYSEGFRIPAFAEANALPSTGFVSNTISLFNDAYLAQYGCSLATYNSCPAYINQASYGLTNTANPNLKPEDATSFTLGAILFPFKGLDIAVDYWQIEKTGAIAPPTAGTVVQAYYQGLPIPAPFVVIPDGPDPNFPLALPRVAFVQSPLENADKWNAEGWDLAINLTQDLDDGISFNTALDVSYISRLTTLFADGHLERYDGTLGNNNYTAGTGTPAWRGTWRTTVYFGDYLDVTATANYYSGYDLSAMDAGTGYKDCGLSHGTTPCDIDAYVTVDLGGQVHVTDNATLYLNMLNVADEMPPVDVVGNYGISGYNPVVAGNGIYGRYFRAGVKLDY